MPTYDFKCRKCGHRFELFLRITDTSDATCPRCGNHADRLISAGGGLIFKGGGFYATDYRKAGYMKDKKSDG
jgi:putative FmdB family regulatory protein